MYFERSDWRASEDDAIITMHWRSADPAGGDSGDDMTTNTRDNVVSKITGFLDTCLPLLTTKMTPSRAVFYEVPDVAGRVERIDEYPIGVGAGGSGADPLPPQVACSVTFRTDKRKNWGRFYLPGLTISTLDADGSLESGAMDQIATAAQQMCDRGGLNTETLCVWSPTEKTHHDPQQVVVDDIYDIIRSRRFRAPLRRAIKDAG